MHTRKSFLITENSLERIFLLFRLLGNSILNLVGPDVFIASAVEEEVVRQVQATPADFHGGRDEYRPYLGYFLQQTETHSDGVVRGIKDLISLSPALK